MFHRGSWAPLGTARGVWRTSCAWTPLPAGTATPSKRFESERARLKRGDIETEAPEVRRLLELVSLYDDRASYRVTDVSSVLARDVSIHLFSEAFLDTPSRRGSDELLTRLRSDSARPTQTLVFGYVEATQWGEPLVETTDVR